MFDQLILTIKEYFRQETGAEMRERINRQNREYNEAGIASIKFYKGEWYD